MDAPPPTISWALRGVLADCHRPGFPVINPSVGQVQEWVDVVLREGIRSVLCIMEPELLASYEHLGLKGGGLLQYYQSRGLKATSIPVANNKLPPLSRKELEKVWEAFQSLETPVLVHCDAGVNRTGSAVHHILGKLRQNHHPVA